LFFLEFPYSGLKQVAWFNQTLVHFISNEIERKCVGGRSQAIKQVVYPQNVNVNIQINILHIQTFQKSMILSGEGVGVYDRRMVMAYAWNGLIMST